MSGLRRGSSREHESANFNPGRPANSGARLLNRSSCNSERAKLLAQELGQVSETLSTRVKKTKDVALLEHENNRIREDIEVLYRKKEEVMRDIQGCKDIIYRKNEKISELREEIDQVDKQIREIEQKNVSRKQFIKEQEESNEAQAIVYQRDLEDLENRLELLEEKDHNARDYRSRLKSELTVAQERLAAVESSNIELEARKASLQAEISSVTQAISTSDAKNTVLRTEAAKNKMKLEENMSLFSTIEEDYSAVLKKLRELESTSQSLHHENYTLRSRAQRYKH